jgi:hypothetical protein
MEDFKSAEDVLAQALIIQRKIYPKLGTEIGKSLYNLGVVYWVTKRFLPAIEALEGCKSVRLRDNSPKSIKVGEVSSLIARILLDQGREIEAEEVWRKLAEQFGEGRFGPNDSVVLQPNFSVSYDVDENDL